MERRLTLVATVLAVLVLVPPTADAQAADTTATVETLVGSWVGEMDSESHLVFHVDRREDGTLNGTADSPEQGVFGVPVSRIRVEEDSVTFAFDSGRFEGKMQTGEERITGAWISAESSASLTLVPLADSVAAELAKPPEARRPEARPADVESPGALVAAAYEVISGPAGEEPDWDRFRSLFLPEAQFIRTDRVTPVPRYRIRTVEEFVDPGPRGEAFYEDEIHSVTERYGDIAHVFSSYASRRSPDGEPFSRGINSFQLWYDGDRWWIVDIFWHVEHDEAPIPERYGG